MDRTWRKPPGWGRLSDGDVSADGFDIPNIISSPVHPRKRAASTRPPGPGELAAIEARQRLHRPRLKVIDGGRP